MPSFHNSLKKAKETHHISDIVYENFKQLYDSYSETVKSIKMDQGKVDHIFETYLEKVEIQHANPYPFQPYHQKVTEPFDYYQFGIDFTRPLVDLEKSKILHPENLDKIEAQLKANENVVLFANHQTEVDPQLISIALEMVNHPKIGAEMIFVAGDRVITDPLAVPLSVGRNLLCIYSKRRIENPPERKLEKQQHNQRTMRRMKELFSEGGKCIYVAPSGGRDRMDEKGGLTVSAFDPQSIEMFRLMAEQADRPTHFYSLALYTYEILPPPPAVEHTQGEERKAKREGIFFAFGNEIDMKNYKGSDLPDRHERRAALSTHIWNQVKADYDQLTK